MLVEAVMYEDLQGSSTLTQTGWNYDGQQKDVYEARWTGSRAIVISQFSEFCVCTGFQRDPTKIGFTEHFDCSELGTRY